MGVLCEPTPARPTPARPKPKVDAAAVAAAAARRRRPYRRATPAGGEVVAFEARQVGGRRAERRHRGRGRGPAHRVPGRGVIAGAGGVAGVRLPLPPAHDRPGIHEEGARCAASSWAPWPSCARRSTRSSSSTASRTRSPRSTTSPSPTTRPAGGRACRATASRRRRRVRRPGGAADARLDLRLGQPEQLAVGLVPRRRRRGGQRVRRRRRAHPRRLLGRCVGGGSRSWLPPPGHRRRCPRTATNAAAPPQRRRRRRRRSGDAVVRRLRLSPRCRPERPPPRVVTPGEGECGTWNETLIT